MPGYSANFILLRNKLLSCMICLLIEVISKVRLWDGIKEKIFINVIYVVLKLCRNFLICKHISI